MSGETLQSETMIETPSETKGETMGATSSDEATLSPHEKVFDLVVLAVLGVFQSAFTAWFLSTEFPEFFFVSDCLYYLCVCVISAASFSGSNRTVTRLRTLYLIIFCLVYKYNR